jgi:enhancing lycopene biosynthesis protein 2
MKKVGVLLAGCGVFDGAEIGESILTLLALEKAGVQAICMAPDKEQYHVVNHLTGKATDERRNVLVEAARIARGNIENLAAVKVADLDALVLPGGFGAAKNLSTFAIDVPEGTVDPEVRRLVTEMFEARKPLGFICISPAVGAQILGQTGLEVTIGNDESTARGIEAFGAHHVNCSVSEIHIDEERRVISTPAFMLGQNLVEVSKGIDKLVQTLVHWIS